MCSKVHPVAGSTSPAKIGWSEHDLAPSQHRRGHSTVLYALTHARTHRSPTHCWIPFSFFHFPCWIWFFSGFLIFLAFFLDFWTFLDYFWTFLFFLTHTNAGETARRWSRMERVWGNGAWRLSSKACNLFPLTSRWPIVAAWVKRCRRMCSLNRNNHSKK